MGHIHSGIGGRSCLEGWWRYNIQDTYRGKKLTIVRTIILLFLCQSFGATWASTNIGNHAKSVVKLYVTSQAWNTMQPWIFSYAEESTCSGFFIEQGILTNAHCIANAKHLQVRVPGQGDTVRAEVIAVNHEVDLALIRLVDSNIIRKPVSFGELPRHLDRVVTVGFPMGGDQVSFTEGVVSRIDMDVYSPRSPIFPHPFLHL